MLQTAQTAAVARHEASTQSFVTFEVAGQLFGVPVMKVQDILTPDAIAPVPGGPAEVRGLINLRGRIVTVIDLRKRLGLRYEGERKGMCVTVENEGESYTLFVDGVGDVVTLQSDAREDSPTTLDPLWKELSDGVFRVDGRLLLILDVGRLLAIRSKQ
ncbi:MAG: chemotaxis protein CheW [Alphaproteobacteria bacterium]|nr:chemotaxis protein CheW [Alphaproteobacteria bacterium]MBL6936519.1 chemotaxis protein CheW [Alphaproteobacteria bacterium]MBL7098430.1 chemotaxis protein CheW [Alphaproteobacteria bacterium]